MNEKFGNWLRQKIDEQKISQSELARKSKISTGQISRILSGARGAEGKTLSAIAKALGIPEDIIFREAGIMSQGIEIDELSKQGTYILERLSIENRKIAIKHLRLSLSIQKEQERKKAT